MLYLDILQQLEIIRTCLGGMYISPLVVSSYVTGFGKPTSYAKILETCNSIIQNAISQENLKPHMTAAGLQFVMKSIAISQSLLRCPIHNAQLAEFLTILDRFISIP